MLQAMVPGWRVLMLALGTSLRCAIASGLDAASER